MLGSSSGGELRQSEKICHRRQESAIIYPYRSSPLSNILSRLDYVVNATAPSDITAVIRARSGKTWGLGMPSSWRQQSHVHRQRQAQTKEHCDAACNAVPTTASLQQCHLDFFFQVRVAVSVAFERKPHQGI